MDSCLGNAVSVSPWWQVVSLETRQHEEGLTPLLCRLGPQVVIKTYKGAEHTKILENDDAVADLLDILTEDFSKMPGFLQRVWRLLPAF